MWYSSLGAAHRVPFLVSLAAAVVLPACNDEISAPQPTVPGLSLDISTANPGSWASRASLPTARSGIGSGVIRNALGQDIMYVVGGQSPDGDLVTLTRMDAYNASTNKWTRRADLPAPRHHPMVAALGGKLYAAGGRVNLSYSRTLYVYTPSSNKWIRKADMPIGSLGGRAVGIGTKLYVLTGYMPPQIPAPARLYRYDPTTNVWKQRESPPGSCGNCAAGVINGKLYLVSIQGLVERYDPASNQWTRVHTPVEADWEPYMGGGSIQFLGAQGVTLNQQLYVIGGFSNGPDGISSRVFAYNPATDSWSKKADMLHRRVSHTVGKVKNAAGVLQIMVMGGWSNVGISGEFLRQTEAFTP